MNPKSTVAGKSLLTPWEFPDDLNGSLRYAELHEKLGKLFNDIQTKAFSLLEFDRYSRETCKAFESDPWGLFRVALDQKVYPSIASLSLNVALLVYLYARSQRWSFPQTDLLVRAALLHDVGMLFLPKPGLSMADRLTEKEKASFEAHPSVSMETVKGLGESFESTQVALQHHEQWSGGGYPGRLTGSQIHPWAAIVSVCLGFVGYVAKSGDTNSLPAYEAVKKLIQDQNDRFHTSVVKDFVKAVGVYPPGSILLLSDGSITRVVAVNETSVVRPSVRILIDHFGILFPKDTGRLLDLNDTPELFIARAVDLEELIPDGIVKSKR